MRKNAEPLEPCALPDHGCLPLAQPQLQPQARPLRRQPARELATDADLPFGGDSVPDERIIGSGDRMHHLALVPGHPAPAPPWPGPASRRDAGALVLPPGPGSRAECRRRCGKAGLCDPSSALGCGGEYCDSATAAAREAIFEPGAPGPGTAAPHTPLIDVQSDYL